MWTRLRTANAAQVAPCIDGLTGADEPNGIMRETAVFFLFLLTCLVLAAATSVPLVQTGWFDYPPHRIMGRLAQAFILLGLWPFLRWRGLASREALGYGPRGRRWLRTLAGGWLLGLVILLVLVLALLLLEIRQPDLPVATSWLLGKAAQALIAGLLIGVLEETFFRGALYTGIRRRHGVATAAAWSALLYAILHVMKPGPLPLDTTFDAAAAAQMFLAVFSGVFDWSHLDTLVALFLVGIFLALVRERTGHIGWCVGLHAGWVLVIQVTRRLTDGNPQSQWRFLVGDYDGVIGWLAAAWIGLLTLAYWTLTGRRRADERASDTRRTDER